MHEAPDRGRGRITLDALARQRLTYEPLEGENLNKLSPLPAPLAAARLHLGRTPFPKRPHLPPVADGITAQPSAANLPDEIEPHFDVGDLTITIVIIRPELIVRRRRSTERVDSQLILIDIQ